MEKRKCENCGKEFECWNHQKRKYCSIACFRKMPKTFSKMTLSKKECIELYFNRKLSFYKIRDKTGIPVNSLVYWFKKWGLEARKGGESQEGELNHNYKDGLGSNFYRAYIRDKKKCKICGYKRIVTIHHIKYRCDDGKDNLRNLITLCPSCHRLVHEGIIEITSLNKWEDSNKIHNKYRHEVRVSIG